MSLRAQLAIFTGLLVAAAVIVVSVVAYFGTKDRLRSQIDSTLQSREQTVGDAPGLPRGGPGAAITAVAGVGPVAPSPIRLARRTRFSR